MLVVEAVVVKGGAMSARYSPIMSSLSELSSRSRKAYFPVWQVYVHENTVV